MDSMNWIGPCNLRLCSRNEGKIKSYDSCGDVRAWSHDVRKRDRYLREWIKCDMPICVLPTSTLARFMRTMTCRSRCRATPRCHPNCKSKAILDSICNSCHAMKECLKNEENFDKYFDDEEFETSQWPCERCLEALKSIKMFWRIIIEKLFNINIPKQDDTEQECCRSDSVRSVAKVWQSEMVQQAMYVRNMTPYCNRTSALPNTCIWRGTKNVKKVIPPCKRKSCDFEDHDSYTCRTDLGKPDCVQNNYTIRSFKAKSTDTDCLSNPTVCRSNKTCPSFNRKQNRQCAVKTKLVDTACDACNQLNSELKAYKKSVELLQNKCNCQKKEIEKLKRENSSLRLELQNVYKNTSWKSKFFAPSECSTSNKDAVALLPKPFECCPEDNINTRIKGVDSEMIITMKNCKNETYTHISLLQVLHKTNDPVLGESSLDSCCNRKEDPIQLLTKVQNTFGAIVKREMCIANEREDCATSDIDATFHTVNSSKSAPSCSTICSFASSDSPAIRSFI